MWTTFRSAPPGPVVCRFLVFAGPHICNNVGNIKAPEFMCPDCRSYEVRRRKREGLRLYLASFFGAWPYRCDSCGSEFYLKKRYPHRKRPEVISAQDVEVARDEFQD